MVQLFVDRVTNNKYGTKLTLGTRQGYPDTPFLDKQLAKAYVQNDSYVPDTVVSIIKAFHAGTCYRQGSSICNCKESCKLSERR